MGYIELFSDNIFDLIDLGKTTSNFDSQLGDYLKVEVYRGNQNNIIGTLYSNKLLLKYSDQDSYYLGEYHYHKSNPTKIGAP